jgi:hypothetical protein
MLNPRSNNINLDLIFKLITSETDRQNKRAGKGYSRSNPISGYFVYNTFFSLLFISALRPIDNLSVLTLQYFMRLYQLKASIILFIPSGLAAQRGLWPPRSRRLLITHNDAPQSVGLLWTSDQFVA